LKNEIEETKYMHVLLVALKVNILERKRLQDPQLQQNSYYFLLQLVPRNKSDIMLANIPYVFVQTKLGINGNDKMIMKIHGKLVDMLVKSDPDLYESFVVEANNNQILHVILLKALYCT
jgi:hypothetical protein